MGGTDGGDGGVTTVTIVTSANGNNPVRLGTGTEPKPSRALSCLIPGNPGDYGVDVTHVPILHTRD